MHDVRTEKIVQHYEAHSGSVNDIAVHPDGSFMVSVSSNEIKVIIFRVLGLGLEEGSSWLYDIRSQRRNQHGQFFEKRGLLCDGRS